MQPDDIVDRFLVQGRAFQRWLAADIRNVSKIKIAVGYLSPEGLGLLLSILAPHLSRIEKVQIIAGELQISEDGEQISNLRKSRIDLAGKLEIRHRPRQVQEGIFHPKVYLLYRDGGWVGTIGSSNLTAQAWKRNVEADVVIRREVAGEILDAFEDWWTEGTPVPPDEWPTAPELAAQLNRALAAGVLVRPQVDLQRATASYALDDDGDAFVGELFRLKRIPRATFPLVDPGALRDMSRVVGRIRQKLRKISLNTPWDARFVPEVLLPQLYQLLAQEEDPLRRAVQCAGESVLSTEQFRELAERDATKAVETRPPETRAIERKKLLDRAVQIHREFVSLCPRPLDARIDIIAAPTLDRGLQAGPPELSARIEATAKTKWVEFLVTVASAPRRSFRKYNNPERAKALCLLPDNELAEMVDGPAPATPLFLPNREKPDRTSDLTARIREIERWRRESLDTVLTRLAVLLGMESA